MVKNILIFIVIATLNNVTTQNIDYITATPVIVQDPTFDSKWEHLMPTLKMIKSTSNIKKERLLNVVKVIKFLLSDEVEKNECDKILEEIKEPNEFQTDIFPDMDSVIDERLNTIKEAFNNENCKINDDEDKIVLQNNVSQNKTADFTKILAKISAALAKLSDQNEEQEMQKTPAPMGMFRFRNNVCKNNFNPPSLETSGQSPYLQSQQARLNFMSQETKFTIPCQRASDILKETSTFVVPKGAYCDLPKNINLNSIMKVHKLNSDNLPLKVIPNSVTCVDAEDSIAVLFRPKKISMMQVYGNLLKKIAVTVLVPYHVSKMSL